jgi:hypothetical protein
VSATLDGMGKEALGGMGKATLGGMVKVGIGVPGIAQSWARKGLGGHRQWSSRP